MSMLGYLFKNDWILCHEDPFAQMRIVEIITILAEKLVKLASEDHLAPKNLLGQLA
jgi:hypothetical protein